MNKEDYSDSELIIQKLQEKFNKFPDADVSKEDKAVGLAMRIMMEEHFYWLANNFKTHEKNSERVNESENRRYIS